MLCFPETLAPYIVVYKGMTICLMAWMASRNEYAGYNFRTRIQSFLAFGGAHMRICDAKDCKSGRWTI